MKEKFEENISIPEGIECKFENNILKCNKETAELTMKIDVFGLEIKVKSNEVIFSSERVNKKGRKIVISIIQHVRNMFKGLTDGFEYELEAVNVHFPMTLKVQDNKVLINNFLGEKVPREAVIMPEVNVDIQGQKIVVSSQSLEYAGQTASNIEKAVRITNRDRRIFQDGIYITKKPRYKK